MATSGNVLGTILQMVLSQPGGLSGLINTFEQGGLGTVIKSWVGTGENHPVSASQLSGVFGPDQLSELAAHFGGDTDRAHAALAEHLPNLVDKLTPEGTVPDDDDWMKNAGNRLGDLLK